jgi:hypothetical protein
MLWTNALIFSGVLLIIIFLYRFYKSLELKNKIKICDFKLSKTKFREEGDKRFAKFSVSLKDKNQFFIDFPVSFRFYSDTRFKTKIRITYEAVKSGREPEEIINKCITFETKSLECIHRINDIIIGQIDIEIVLKPYYGDPVIEFEILENNLCKLQNHFKKIIEFPKKSE